MFSYVERTTAAVFHSHTRSNQKLVYVYISFQYCLDDANDLSVKKNFVWIRYLFVEGELFFSSVGFLVSIYLLDC